MNMWNEIFSSKLLMKSFFNCMDDIGAKVYGTGTEGVTFIHLSQLLNGRPVIQSDVSITTIDFLSKKMN